MGRKCDLIASEKSIITSELANGKSILEISKIIGRYHQTAKKFVTAPTKIRKRADKDTMKSSFSQEKMFPYALWEYGTHSCVVCGVSLAP
ncbi:Hypothetical predicted protein [Octopus vulgaris]|uniref:Tc3 transposase DNA binding domain-containing protein n=1 Tax=Octopus vulgaris TaxID=6645 RepID=A0AA36BK30_OCTVU|nr:Hypothetical predicted protein [Octopus vulgaris]